MSSNQIWRNERQTSISLMAVYSIIYDQNSITEHAIRWSSLSELLKSQ